VGIREAAAKSDMRLMKKDQAGERGGQREDTRNVFSEKNMTRRKKRRKKRTKGTKRSVQEWSFCECSCSIRNGRAPPG
jgi:hypothetical protein